MLNEAMQQDLKIYHKALLLQGPLSKTMSRPKIHFKIDCKQGD